MVMEEDENLPAQCHPRFRIKDKKKINSKTS